MALTDDAIGQIKRMIQSGELRPGDRLPPEQELSERLGLSRSSMREAVKALDAMRVLDVRRGDGTYVTSLEPQLLLEAMSFVLDFHHSSAVLDVFEVRCILEAASARMAAQRASEQSLALMREALEAAKVATDVEQLVQQDVAFHRAIATSGGNGYLASLIETVSSQTARARMWRGIGENDAIARTLGEHQQIMEAIEQGDTDLAGSLMTVHVRGVQQWLQSQIDESRHDSHDPALHN